MEVQQLINAPYEYIHKVFVENGGASAANLDVAALVAENARRILNFDAGDASNELMQIPSLNATPTEFIPRNSLVRFRCIVQDMFDPECHLGKFEEINQTTGAKTIKTGAFADMLHLSDNCIMNEDRRTQEFLECQSMYCISPPGEAVWLNTLQSAANTLVSSGSTSSQTKRSSSAMEEDDNSKSSNSVDAIPAAQILSSTSSVLVPSPSLTTAPSFSTAISAVSDSSCMPTATAVLQRFGAPSAINAIVRFYRSEDADAMRLGGRIIEVVAILTKDPDMELDDDETSSSISAVYHDVNMDQHRAECDDEESSSSSSSSASAVTAARSLRAKTSDTSSVSASSSAVPFDAWERAAHHPPASLVHRLHGIVWRPISDMPGFPFGRALKPAVVDKDAAALAALKSQLGNARTSLLEYLSSLLGGDRVSAELLMLHLISRIHTRADTLALGKFALNLFGVSEQQSSTLVRHLTHLYRNLLPRTQSFPLSLQSLGSVRFAPRKDYEVNRIEAGLLYVGFGTHFLFDETQMQPGQLTPQATSNLKALAYMMQWGKLSIDLGDFAEAVEVDADVSVFIVSTSKSLVPPDCRTQWMPTAAVPATLPEVSAEMLESWRLYLALCRSMSFTIPDAVSEIIQQDFIALRQQSKEISQDILHYFISLSRLLSVSHLEESLTAECWNAMRALDSQRSRQVSVNPASTSSSTSSSTGSV